MNKLYISLVLISHICYASVPVNPVIMYQEDIVNGTKKYASQLKKMEEGKKLYLKEFVQDLKYIDQRKKECAGFVDVKKTEIVENGFQLTELQKRLKYQNDAWLAENNKKFEPQISITKAQAALARYQRLSPQMQWQEAQSCVIPGVCTPEGIMHYWQAKVNGNLAEEQYFFNQQKQQRLNQIESDRFSIVVVQIPENFQHKKMIEKQHQDIASNVIGYDSLRLMYIKLQNDVAAVKRKNAIHRFVSMYQVNALRKQQQVQLIQAQQNEQAEKLRLEESRRLLLAEQQKENREQLKMMEEENLTKIFVRQEKEKLAQRALQAEQLQKIELARLHAEQFAREQEEQQKLQQEQRLAQSQKDKQAHVLKMKHDEELRLKEEEDKKAKLNAQRELIKAKVEAAKLLAAQKEEKEKKDAAWIAQQAADRQRDEVLQIQQKIEARRNEYFRLKAICADQNYLKEKLDEYDHRHNIFQDEALGARQSIFAVRDLMALPIEDNILLLGNIVNEIYFLDKSLRAHNQSIDHLYSSEESLHAAIESRLTIMNDQCLGMTTDQINREHIRLSNASQHVRKSIDDMCSSTELAPDVLKSKFAIENKKFADFTKEMDCIVALLKKSVVRDALHFLQTIIMPKPNFATVGILQPNDLQEVRQAIKNVILKKGKLFQARDIQELMHNLGVKIGLSHKDQEELSRDLVETALSRCFCMNASQLTPVFKQNVFEHRLIQLSNKKEYPIIGVNADFVKIQLLLIDVFIEHKSTLKKP